ncbi:MAG: LamG domain-containing protein [Bacteroidota bacterium]
MTCRPIQSNRTTTLVSLVAFLFLSQACSTKQNTSESTAKEETNSLLKEALTFYASFDNGINADFSLGDAQLYTSPIKSIDSARAGLHKPDIRIAQDSGLVGSGLKFTERSPGYIFYRSEKNLAYDTSDWSGAVSFWLSLDPATDLKPGYCDPIQITDVSYNDAAIWVDFTKENPRDFRLGVIGDRSSWNPSPEGPDNENPIFIQQLPVVKQPPFAQGKWTHVFINFSHLNTDKGTASLYIDGKEAGTRSNIADPFTWDYPKSNMLLGLGYIGLMDEVSIYNRPLTQEEITTLFEVKDHVKTLL